MSTSTTESTVASPGDLVDDKIGREDRSALLCCHEPAYAQYLATELRALGYKLHSASSHDEGIERLTTSNYHLTVVLENLEGCVLKENRVLSHLADLPNDDRRATYVVLLCQSFATGDGRGAYALCVNQLIAYQDIGQFASLVAPAIEEHDDSNYHFKTIGAKVAA